jgi:hypothetical protein
MTLEKAMKIPFTAEYQPSLMLKSARSRNITVVDGVGIVGRDRSFPVDVAPVNKAFMANHVRGVVECKKCMKPRCLFPTDALNRMKPAPIARIEPIYEGIKACREYAMQLLEAASEKPLYICGMRPLEPDKPVRKLIISRDGLECHDPVEFEYYTHPYHNAKQGFEE